MEEGVRRLVLLSGRGEEEAQRAERAVQETGADLTVVRCAWFMQNFSEDYLVDPILGGEVVLRPATSPSRSSTPKTSPTSPSRCLPTTGT